MEEPHLTGTQAASQADIFPSVLAPTHFGDQEPMGRAHVAQREEANNREEKGQVLAWSSSTLCWVFLGADTVLPKPSCP